MSNYEDEEQQLRQIPITYSYPDNPDWEYTANMPRIDMDKECEIDLSIGEGFIVSEPQTTIKKDIKDPNGIFSPKFGQKLGDLNPYIDRYSCECGELKSAINKGIICPKCHTVCRFRGDDFKMFGWVKLNDHYPIIHPDIYVQLDSLLGKSKFDKKSKNKLKGSKLKNILDYDIPIDLNGQEIDPEACAKPGEPFYGRGFLYFYDHFDDIVNYYYKQNPKKKEIYDDIMADRDKVFIHSIPVFTALLRPMDISAGSMYFEKCTAIYNMIVKLAHKVNKCKNKTDRTPKIKNQEIFNLQMKFMDLYNEIVSILNGKKGVLRQLISGRYNFSARCVIRQDPSLRIDQVSLPYKALVLMFKAQIENILHRMYNISFQEAYDRWYKAVTEVDPTILKILEMLIEHGHINPETGEEEPGIPVFTDRNPSINYGSFQQAFCVKINTNDYTMGVSLQSIKKQNADFDGDVLNILLIINRALFERAYYIMNPRNAMYISRANGMCDKDVLVQRDTLINANTLTHLGHDGYTENDINIIKNLSLTA